LGRAGRRLMEGMMAVDLSMPILVVDDYNTMIRIICNLLKQLG
jgi:two-component system chemotaxis response regulator CheY